MDAWELRRSKLNPKRNQLASFLARSGVTRLLEALPRRDCLIVLNYHRIGSRGEASGDPGVYSATAEDFDQQVAWITRHYHVTTLDQAIDFIEGRRRFRTSAVLFTFDDGYKDNYDHAYPILKSYGAQGTFFLCTSYVDSKLLPWWDRIAYMLKQSRRGEFTLPYPEPITVDLATGASGALDRLLRVYKSEPGMDKKRFLESIAEATGVWEAPQFERHFVNWVEASEMASGGMAIGSHTHSHELLSHLTAERQFEELAKSKRILEETLGIAVDALAYPVGSQASFDERTEDALRQAGYRIAFSFYGGVNTRGRAKPYDVMRQSVDVGSDGPLLRLRTVAAALTAKSLV